MRRLAACAAAALVTGTLTSASAWAASDSGHTSVPIDPATAVEMHVDANCTLATSRCTFKTWANLLAGGAPTGFPGDTWARQTITLRSSDRAVWQEAFYSAPAGMPREDKGANHDNVLSALKKSLNTVEISVTYFGGGPIERFTVDGDSTPIDWYKGHPNTDATFIACSVIQVVRGGSNVTTPPACAQTKFS
ncbi:hypothetical protein [Mycolicibacterium smegmatis]|uniref:hypothetical protein n=1 Tax=Mycolicibacterium smegmatis TaxID=1772 RepID=UPI0013039C83|nr:hypothetical protein [Mycolicibacterium smegmatis]